MKHDPEDDGTSGMKVVAWVLLMWVVVAVVMWIGWKLRGVSGMEL